MTIELRKLLENAKGTTEHIIAIILDIRGFTPFCKEEESLNVANFIKRVYIKIMDDYLPQASFYKPTGDGLLIVIPYTAETLKDALNSTMANCLKLIDNFGKLREGDDMIYFPTPDKLGIGISRGLACCISSGGTIIDYSGRVINLASRLNDFARPSGIVFDSSLGITLLPKEMQELFLRESVCIRGVAEEKLTTIYFTKQYTIIPPSRKELLREPEWVRVQREATTVKYLKDSLALSNGFYGISLHRRPLDEKQITVQFFYDLDSSPKFFFLHTDDKGVECKNFGIEHIVSVEFSVLVKLLDRERVGDDSKVKLVVSYPAVPIAKSV